MKNILKLTAILFAITAIVAAALAGVNLVTKDKIAAAKQEKVRAAVAAVLPGGEAQTLACDGLPDVTALYENENGYAVQVETAGFGGTLTLMVGISREGKVLGVQVVSHSETPGLGAKAQTDEAFLSGFVGKDGTLSVSKDGGDVDTLTSATITSRAVVNGVNAALNAVKTLG